MTMLRAEGTRWVKESGTPINLKGTNLGNWLVQEFWMMGQGGNGVTDQCTLEAELTDRFGYEEKERLMKVFHDSWLTERDWDQLQAFGFNVVRLPFLWSVIEDEQNPKTLREDAWHYLDWAIAEAKERGIYVILDLHGALGGQTPNDHTGCAGQNQYWTNAEYQDRTKWLWEQVATRYKDEPAVAAYDPLNEPWGSTAEDMATRVLELYETIRAIDDKHIIMLHSHYGSIDVYGDPAEEGLTNVAFELHPYPGLFGDRPNDSHYEIHRDWLRCGQSGTGGVCDWNTRLTALDTPMLMGEFQPWQSAGLELGGKIGRATYDIYAQYGWASTSWSYKLVSIAGGQGAGTWGMVTNVPNTGLDVGVGQIVKASTWDCNGWDSTFAEACADQPGTISPKGEGSKTYYIIIKTGANAGSNPDVTFDNISLINTATDEEMIVNGDFGTADGWSELSITGSLAFNYNATDAGKLPAGAEGPVLHITRPDGVVGEINGALYQAVTLDAGQSYEFSGVFKGNTSTNTWAEIYLIEEEPVAGVDVVDNAGRVDFTTASAEEIEALFASYGTVEYDVHSGLAHWLVTDEHNDVFDYPERPTNVVLTEAEAGNALTWDAVAGEGISYTVYRSTTPAGVRTAIAEDLTVTNYTDTDLVDGETYFYTITAANTAGESYRSDEVHTELQYVVIPARIEAENYSAMLGIQVEACTDIGGGQNAGWFDANDWVEYQINVPTAGDYTISYRVASQDGSTNGFDLLLNDVEIDSKTIAATGGWQSWTTISSTITLPAGDHTLRFNMLGGGGWNMNWIEISAD
jgi:endoglucanase